MHYTEMIQRVKILETDADVKIGIDLAKALTAALEVGEGYVIVQPGDAELEFIPVKSVSMDGTVDLRAMVRRYAKLIKQHLEAEEARRRGLN